MKKRYFLFGCVLLMACGTTTPPSPPAPPVFTGTVTGVTIDTRVFNVRENGSSVLLGIVSGTGDFNQALNWKIESGGVGKLSSTTGNNVLYTAPSSTFGQVVRITASSVQDPTQKKTIYLGVHTKKPSIAAGSEHSLALKSDGTVLSWGSDSAGQLGNVATNPFEPTPVAVSGLTDIVAVVAGENHSLALKANGDLYAWGSDSDGQIGNGGAINTNQPLPVQFMGGVVAISAGSKHSLALSNNGDVFAWGSDSNGQLGDGGTNTNVSSPSYVYGAVDFIAISAGGNYSLGLKSDGTVSGWGNGSWDKFNLGSISDVTTPVSIPKVKDIVSISAGDSHILALKSNGTMLSWGLDFYGQLGNGGTNAFGGFGPVLNAIDIMAISAGANHSMALKTDGTVLAWGANSSGEIGDGNTATTQGIPIVVSGANGVVAISGGGTHSLALKSDGTMLSWGRDNAGQLGNNATLVNQPTPVSVLLGTFTIRVP